MSMSERRAREKLDSAFDRRQLSLAITNSARRELLVELLMTTSEVSIAGAVFEAIEGHLSETTRPSVEKAGEMLKKAGYITDRGLQELSDKKIMSVYGNYFPLSYEIMGEDSEAPITEIDLNNDSTE